jgi:hypothetical protein
MYTLFMSIATVLLSIVLSVLFQWHFGFACFFAIGFGLFALAMTSSLVAEYMPRKLLPQPPATLVAMRTTDATFGTFVLRTGSLKGGIWFNVYVKNEDGSYTPHQIRGDQNVRIIEDESLEGVAYWTTVKNVRDYNTPLAKWTLSRKDDASVAGEELRVPRGTVRQTFEVL